MTESAAKPPPDVTTYANLRTEWKDVAGLQNVKDVLNEAVVIPNRFPQLFSGIKKPRTGILFYGPQGCGKFYLTTAVASEAKCSVLLKVPCQKISKSGILTEGYIEQLFRAARHAKPCLLFFEEFDYLHGTHPECADEGQDEMRTKFYTEFFKHEENQGMTIIGSTSRPWNLNHFLTRQFAKRIYIPMPDAERRSELFKIHLRCLSEKCRPIIPNTLTEEDFRILGEESDGCSVDDIGRVIQDIMRKPERMQPIVLRVTRDDSSTDTKTDAVREYQYVSFPSTTNVCTSINDAHADSDREETLQPISMVELTESVQRHKTCVNQEDLLRYEECRKRWGED